MQVFYDEFNHVFWNLNHHFSYLPYHPTYASDQHKFKRNIKFLFPDVVEI